MKLSALTLLLALLAAVPGFAAREKAPPDPLAPGLSGPDRLAALVERVKLEQRNLKTLEARFTQDQQSSMLTAREQSKGLFSYAAPDKVRWEYASPSPITVVIRGDEMTTWYKDLKRAETLKVGRYSNQIFKYLGASGSLQTLLEYFTVRLKLPEKKGDLYRMELLPKYQRIAKRLKSMTLWIDGETFFPSRLKYEEPDGDTVDYQFSDFKRNTPIPDDRFVVKLPPGVEKRTIDLSREGAAKSKP
ncbi:MAG TPA: outer membrane lipoprotein carrier protein LolA [Thermoanaerobaculia bacterium]|jgi:outer membrane lipoprotein-sorting protein|nr:outer membrane lipoprotein carrier protein LolA [Thermoanaerobaculia bacterium]